MTIFWTNETRTPGTQTRRVPHPPKSHSHLDRRHPRCANYAGSTVAASCSPPQDCPQIRTLLSNVEALIWPLPAIARGDRTYDTLRIADIVAPPAPDRRCASWSTRRLRMVWGTSEHCGFDVLQPANVDAVSWGVQTSFTKTIHSVAFIIGGGPREEILIPPALVQMAVSPDSENRDVPVKVCGPVRAERAGLVFHGASGSKVD